MTTPRIPASPLLSVDGLFDERQRAVIERVSAAERAHILALPSDDALDPKRRFRVEATRDELMSQPDAIRRTLARNVDALEVVPCDAVLRLAQDAAGE